MMIEIFWGLIYLTPRSRDGIRYRLTTWDARLVWWWP